MRTSACDIIRALESIRLVPAPSESDIHQLISKALTANGIPYEHEARLGTQRRADFLCGEDMSIIIEVKKGRPNRAGLIKQISGYLEWESAAELIVVTQRHINIPDRLHGKPVYQLALDRLWGIALP